jgi:hypothetical protein
MSSSPSYITGFQHGEYLATLPPPSSLRTPLHFNDAELEMLRGTNLYRASLDRKASWEAEYRECMIVLRGAAHEISLLDRLSWYVAAILFFTFTDNGTLSQGVLCHCCHVLVIACLSFYAALSVSYARGHSVLSPRAPAWHRFCESSEGSSSLVGRWWCWPCSTHHLPRHTRPGPCWRANL